MEKADFEVPSGKLYHFDPAQLDFDDTASVEPLKDFIGQQRAIEALDFGFGIRVPGFNIFVAGVPGSGLDAVIKQHLQKFIAGHQESFKVKDYCYVLNFANHAQPTLLVLEKGEGELFKIFLKDSFSKIVKSAKAFFGGGAYAKKLAEIDASIGGNKAEVYRKLTEQASALGFVFIVNPDDSLNWMARSFNPNNSNEAITKEEFGSLPAEQKKVLIAKSQAIKQLAEKYIKEIDDLRAEKIRSMEKQIVSAIVTKSLSHLNFATDNKVRAYINGLKDFVLEKYETLKPAQNESPFVFVGGPPGYGDNNEGALFLPFNVNVLVSNRETEGAPVVFENRPTFSNLVGKIDRRVVQGAYFTDHTMISNGSLARANDGYLILNMYDLLTSPNGWVTWAKLKNVLKSGLTIEDVADYAGFFTSGGLKPENIPLDVKIIAIGDPMIYALLTMYDIDFPKLFKVKAEFGSDIKANPENFKAYAGFIALCCRKEGLLPFDKNGAAKVIEYAVRLSGSQKNISARFGRVKELLVEANFLAKSAGAASVTSEYVRQALEAKKKRNNLAEDKMAEFIEEGILIVDTDGVKASQINGLAVHQLGDFSFGIPVCITARSFCGKAGLVNIKRKVKMSGQIFEQADEIVAGYLGGQYAQNVPLALSVSLAFEQSYGGIDGDSASVAEILVILSSLSGAGINQGIAVTGSMRQNGLVQPVGGIAEKIEGWFRTCKAKNLVGSQGVIIPFANMDDLVLNEEVSEAVKNGSFHIYAVKHVDEAIFLAFGKEPANVHDLVQKKIEGFYEKIKPAPLQQKGS